ncbi:MAG: hypothetical protein AAB846_01210 [Patescibacteria group bacterium]
MWQNWLLGFLGLWVILMPFLGFPLGLHRALTIITGVLIAVLGFWSASGSRAGEET